MKKTAFFSPLVLLILLSLTSCGFMESQLKGQPVAPEVKLPPVGKRLPKGNQALAKKQEINRISQTRQEVNRRLEEGNLLTALAVIRREVKRGTSEKELGVEYMQALNGAIEQGNSQLAENNPGQAGLLFLAALDSFPKDADLVPYADLTPLELESNIELCADKLMEQGLIAYRAGNLDNAIEVWKKTLAIFPQHRACQNAIQTAFVQLTNLKRITADE